MEILQIRKRRRVGTRNQPEDHCQGSSQQQIVTAAPEASHSDTPDNDPLSLTQLCEGNSSDIVDIVFVHGLTGGSHSTWLHKTSQVYWPSHLLPNDIQDARIFTFGYDADIVRFCNPASNNTVSNHAENMLGDLVRARELTKTEFRKIIFVAHSLGGLVTEEALRISRSSAQKHIRQIERSTVGIVFLGTPHHGSDLAAWGRYVSRLVGVLRSSNKDVLKVLEPGSEMLAVIQQGFHNLVRSRIDENMEIMITCFFEELPVPLVGEIVPKHSARLEWYSNYGIHANHVDMARFSGRQDPGYGKVLGELRRWIRAIREAQEVENAKLLQDQRDCLNSLAFPEMNLREHDIDAAAEETCTWLLRNENYRAWLAQHQGLLWIRGKPGAGKSTLVKYAVRTFKQQTHSDNTVVPSYFFNARGAHIQKTPLGLFRSLLHQLLTQIPDLLSKLTAIFTRRCATEGKHGEKWNWHEKELQNLLTDFLEESTRKQLVWMFIDALDECGEETAVELANYFQRLVSKPHWGGDRLRICFSCRHYPIITLTRGLEVCVEDENRHDISVYVEQNLKDGKFQPRTARELCKQLVTRAEGTFLWVYLVVPRVLQLHRQGMPYAAIKHKIGDIPTKLHELYQETLANMRGEELSQSLHLLQWICCALRPLSLRELRIAMVVDKDRPEDTVNECRRAEDFVTTNNSMERRVTHLSRGLAQVSLQGGIRVAQLIHQSVKDYLLKEGLDILNCSSDGTAAGCAHLRLSISCVKYISFPELSELHELSGLHLLSGAGRSTRYYFSLIRGSADRTLQKFPFLKYATTCWIEHALVVEQERTAPRDLVQILHSPPGRNMLQHWVHAYHIFAPESWDCPPAGTTLLHIAAGYGLSSILDASLRLGALNTDSRDSEGSTPLSWAAERGHEAIVKLLVDRDDVDADSKNVHGQTPLSRAVYCGREAVANLLINREDVEADSKDEDGLTPLSLAAGEGHDAIVRLLVDRNDVDANSRDKYGQTPLWKAADRGRDAVVRLLVSRDNVQVNLKDRWSRTPLLAAADAGHETVVRLLLSRDDVQVERPRSVSPRRTRSSRVY